MRKHIAIKSKQFSTSYNVEVGAELDSVGVWAKKLIGSNRKVAIVSNRKVFALYGEQVVNRLESEGFHVESNLIGDGEKYKDLRTLQSVLNGFSKFELSRTDAVLALGGGIVGDVAGFAAAVHLRGVSCLQVPTTLLSMVDSSVGGKTGINTVFGKNLVGVFSQPKGVLIDPSVLVTLPKRELTAGLCECIKQGAISGKGLFEGTKSIVLDLHTEKIAKLLQGNSFRSKIEAFVAGQVSFKAKIVAGDERESAARNDAKSRKILNFGHTFAHAFERATDYKYLKHGEAVGYGLIFAAQLSEKLGLLNQEVVNLLRDVVYRAGELPPINNIDPAAVFESIRHDKKNVNSTLQWVLLKEIGKPVIVPHNEIGDRTVRHTIKQFIATN